jgi:hypothetical protein
MNDLDLPDRIRALGHSGTAPDLDVDDIRTHAHARRKHRRAWTAGAATVVVLALVPGLIWATTAHDTTRSPDTASAPTGAAVPARICTPLPTFKILDPTPNPDTQQVTIHVKPHGVATVTVLVTDTSNAVSKTAVISLGVVPDRPVWPQTTRPISATTRTVTATIRLIQPGTYPIFFSDRYLTTHDCKPITATNIPTTISGVDGRLGVIIVR